MLSEVDAKNLSLASHFKEAILFSRNAFRVHNLTAYRKYIVNVNYMSFYVLSLIKNSFLEIKI